ncbi:hypothetical protein GOV12_06760 [Candidatus Pacearchaeota archaeon]|nr:hypothetical protein [Candidatus Pacearchaeota archaeon]
MKSIHEKIGMISMYVGLIGGLAMWFGSGITGNIIGETDAVLTGGILLVAGIAGMILYTRSKQKSLLPKKGKIKIKKKKQPIKVKSKAKKKVPVKKKRKVTKKKKK